MAEYVMSDSGDSEEFEGFVVSPEEIARYKDLVRKRSAQEAFGSDDESELSDDDNSDDEEEEGSDSECDEDGADNNENRDELSDDDFDNKEEGDVVLSDDSVDVGMAGVGDHCPICLMSLKEQLLGTPEGCQHVFCLDCICEWVKNVNTCPVDRRAFHEISVHATKKGPVLDRIPVEDRQYVGDAEVFEDDDPTYCQVCGDCDREDRLLLCDNCDNGYHMDCLTPPVEFVPIDEWFCPPCRPSHLTEAHVEGMYCGETTHVGSRIRRSRSRHTAESGHSSAQARGSSPRARTVASVRSSRTAASRRGEGRGRGRGRVRGRTKSRTGSKRKTRSSSSGQKRRKRKVSKKRGKKRSGTKQKTRGTKKTKTPRAKRARLQESLGSTRSTGGELVRNPGRCPFPSRVEPSASFAVFGNSFALHDFNYDNADESAGKDDDSAMTSAPSSEPGNPDVLGSILEGLDTLRSREVARDGRVIPTTQRLRETPTTSSASYTSCTASRRNDNEVLVNQVSCGGKDDNMYTKNRRISEAASSPSKPSIQQRVSAEKTSEVSTPKSDFELFRMSRGAARSSRLSPLSKARASAASSAKLTGYKIPRKASSSPCLSDGPSEKSSSYNRVPVSERKDTLIEERTAEAKTMRTKPCRPAKEKKLKPLTRSYTSPSRGNFPDNEPSTSAGQDTRKRVTYAPPNQQCRNNLDIIQMLRDKRDNMRAEISVEGKEKNPVRNNSLTDLENKRSQSKQGSSFIPVAVVKPSSCRSSRQETLARTSTASESTDSAAMLRETSSSLTHCQEAQNAGKGTAPSNEAPKENERDKQRRLGIARLSHSQQIADEVRLALTPYYRQSVVSREEYKNIMKRAVEKIRTSQSSVDRVRVCSLVEKYIKKVRAESRQMIDGQVAAC